MWKFEPPGFGRGQPDFNQPDFFAATPIVRGEILYGGLSNATEIGSDERRALFALNLKVAETSLERALVWTFTDRDFGGTYGSTAATDELLFVNGADGMLFALDRMTGQKRWQEETNADANNLGAPLVAADHVYVLGENESWSSMRRHKSKWWESMLSRIESLVCLRMPMACCMSLQAMGCGR